MNGGGSVGGPGTLRVGRYIGRLGVVSMPAVAVGLELDERVVRRHVAKLEAAEWLARTPWIRGEGSAVWLTGAGTEAVGLGGVRPMLKSPRSTTLTHGITVGWTAARIQRRGLEWRGSRELAVDLDRWAVPARGEHGPTTLLPDLAVWRTPSAPPVALVVETGGRREDRQKRILEGWRDAVLNGRYSAVQYDCTDTSVTRWINRLARKVGLSRQTFIAVTQTSAAAIGAIPTYLATAELPTQPAAAPKPPNDQPRPSAAAPRGPDQDQTPPPVQTPPEGESGETVDERLQRYFESVGMAEPERRRRLASLRRR